MTLEFLARELGEKESKKSYSKYLNERRSKKIIVRALIQAEDFSMRKMTKKAIERYQIEGFKRLKYLQYDNKY